MSFKFVPYFKHRFGKKTSCKNFISTSNRSKKNSIVQLGLSVMVVGLIGAGFLSTIPSEPELQNDINLCEDVVYSTISYEDTAETTSYSTTHHRLLSAEITEVTMYDVRELVMNSTKVSYSVPKAETGAKRWMDYRHITAKHSMQYKLQQDAWTDEYGFRRYGDYYMIAMGTYYADQCGKLFEITLENGFTFLGLISDIKQDQHTDSMHQHRYGNVVEFIIDKYKIPEMAKKMGDMSYAFDEMNAKIASIREIKTGT